MTEKKQKQQDDLKSRQDEINQLVDDAKKDKKENKNKKIIPSEKITEIFDIFEEE